MVRVPTDHTLNSHQAAETTKNPTCSSIRRQCPSASQLEIHPSLTENSPYFPTIPAFLVLFVCNAQHTATNENGWIKHSHGYDKANGNPLTMAGLSVWGAETLRTAPSKTCLQKEKVTWGDLGPERTRQAILGLAGESWKTGSPNHTPYRGSISNSFATLSNIHLCMNHFMTKNK